MQALPGELFVYHHEKRLVAFQSGRHDKCLIFIGGLTDGFMALGYLPQLAERLDSMGWSLVQVILTSSYFGFGVSSLDQDAIELRALVLALRERKISEIALMGHSTGCQDIVRFLRNHSAADCGVSKVILQAPVSDREYAVSQGINASYMEFAVRARERGELDALMPREAFFAPVTVSRFLSLHERLGDDDMFSSDLTDDELRHCLGHITVPCAMVFSLQDEYVPAHVDVQVLAQRMSAVIGQLASATFLPGNHALDECADALVSYVERVLC